MTGWRKRQIQMEQDKPTIDPARLEQYLEHSMQSALEKQYRYGWNSALEMAAFKLINDFKHAFGDDTLASIAVWIKEQKK